MQWYLLAFRRFDEFSGRSHRREFWSFVLYHYAIYFSLLVVDIGMGTVSPSLGLGPLSGIYAVVSFIPHGALQIRRLHDSERSGWWLLIALVPFVGVIQLLVWFCASGTAGPNHYGLPYGLPALPPERPTTLGGSYVLAPQSSSPGRAEFCMGCGVRLPTGARYCPKCGTHRALDTEGL